MCLWDTGNERTATKDIKVYKVVRITPKGNVMATYQQYRYRRSKIRETEPKVELYRTFNGSVHEGYHSFGYLGGAKKEIDGYGSEYHVMLFIIPKGTKYYKGDYGGDTAYASETIICTKEVINVSK